MNGKRAPKRVYVFCDTWLELRNRSCDLMHAGLNRLGFNRGFLCFDKRVEYVLFLSRSATRTDSTTHQHNVRRRPNVNAVLQSATH